jgi:hypothetical protein
MLKCSVRKDFYDKKKRIVFFYDINKGRWIYSNDWWTKNQT